MVSSWPVHARFDWQEFLTLSLPATDKEVRRLRTIIEQDHIPHEERFQALVDLARLSSSMVSLLANRKDEIGRP